MNTRVRTTLQAMNAPLNIDNKVSVFFSFSFCFFCFSLQVKGLIRYNFEMGLSLSQENEALELER